MSNQNTPQGGANRRPPAVPAGNRNDGVRPGMPSRGQMVGGKNRKANPAPSGGYSAKPKKQPAPGANASAVQNRNINHNLPNQAEQNNVPKSGQPTVRKNASQVQQKQPGNGPQAAGAQKTGSPANASRKPKDESNSIQKANESSLTRPADRGSAPKPPQETHKQSTEITMNQNPIPGNPVPMQQGQQNMTPPYTQPPVDRPRNGTPGAYPGNMPGRAPHNPRMNVQPSRGIQNNHPGINQGNQTPVGQPVQPNRQPRYNTMGYPNNLAGQTPSNPQQFYPNMPRQGSMPPNNPEPPVKNDPAPQQRKGRPAPNAGGPQRPPEPNRKGKKPPEKKRKKAVVNALCIFLAIVVGVVGGAMVYAGNLFSRLGTGLETQEEDFQGTDGNISFELESVNPEFEVVDDVGEISTTSTLRSDPMVQNILLLGSDKREGKGENGWRSDTIIILSIDRRHKTLKLSSILRDTYVSIPGHNDDRINAAFAFGGSALTMKTIESNFGIKIDRHATVSFQVFSKIVDIIGGVDLEITEGEAREINKRSHVKPEVAAGFVHLNGSQTLHYSRIRKIDDDFMRTSRQRKVLEIIIEKMKSATLSEIHEILYEAIPLIDTNLSTEEVLSLVADVSAILQYPVESITIPYNNTWQGKTVRGMSVLVLNMEENRRLLSQFIFESGLSKYYGMTYSGYTYGYGYGNGYGYRYYSTRPAEDSAYSSEGPQPDNNSEGKLDAVNS